MRFLIRWFLRLAFAGIAAATLGAWRFADLFDEDALRPPTDWDPTYSDGAVIAVAGSEITLAVGADVADCMTRNGMFGIRWQGGRGRLGPIVRHGDDVVIREFEAIDGHPEVGVGVAVDGAVFYTDPMTDRGIEFSEVSVDTELGPAPAWFIEGDSDTWVIMTHGKGAERIETLRLLPTIVAAGHPALAITYRNDKDAPADPSGRYQFGLTEWRDLESAVRLARDAGASNVVLVGFSMGGAMTVEFMAQSQLASFVAGVVLDAPMLDLGRTVDSGAAAMGVPGFLTRLSKLVAEYRFGVAWGEMKYLAKAAAIDVPMLLIHGGADRRVPVGISDDLAARRPDLTYLRIENAGHVQSWNIDQAAYESAVVDLLERVG